MTQVFLVIFPNGGEKYLSKYNANLREKINYRWENQVILFGYPRKYQKLLYFPRFWKFPKNGIRTVWVFFQLNSMEMCFWGKFSHLLLEHLDFVKTSYKATKLLNRSFGKITGWPIRPSRKSLKFFYSNFSCAFHFKWPSIEEICFYKPF